VTGHIRIVNDPVDLVPLLITFHNATYKKVYDLLTRSWMTEEELCAQVSGGDVGQCLLVLKKGNLIEEQWRMPFPARNRSRSTGLRTTSSGRISSATSPTLRPALYRTRTTSICGKLVEKVEEESPGPGIVDQ